MAVVETISVGAEADAALGIARSITLAKASGAQNRIDVSGTVKDAEGNGITGAYFWMWLSDDAAGDGESDFSPSTAAATETTGKILAVLDANATTTTFALCKAGTDGAFEFRWTDTAQEDFTFCALPFGGPVPAFVSVVTDDYTD